MTRGHDAEEILQSLELELPVRELFNQARNVAGELAIPGKKPARFNLG
jgi:hypothetical protein